MTLYVSKVTHFKQHRLLVVGTMVPNLLEWIFLFRRKKAVSFVGRGTMWYHYPKETPVPKGVAKKLQKAVNLIKIYG